MGFNTSARARHESAIRDLSLKLKLEQHFQSEIRRFLKNTYHEALSVYAISGRIINFSVFRHSLKIIIYKHYQRVQKVFAFQMRSQITKNFGFMRQTKFRLSFDDGIAYNLESFSNNQSDLTSMEVLKTNQHTFESIIEEVANEYLQIPYPADYQDVAEGALPKLNNNADWRSEMISVTETQNAAENAKFTEAQAFYEAETFGLNEEIEFQQQEMFKYWEAILDERTRPWHADADGQKVLIDEPFEVNGELLMYPRDDSLDASLDNIINCRCAAVYANQNL
jgi:hypothetical protein